MVLPDGYRLIGREREASVAHAFVAAIDGPPEALVITGDAGMGKTALLEQIVGDARRAQTHVLVGGAVERELDLPYTVLADLIGPLMGPFGSALPGPQRAALSGVLLDDEPADPLDLRAIGTAVVSLLTWATTTLPVLIAIDDEPWVDAASRTTLEFALRRLPRRVRVVLTRRTFDDAEGDGLERVLRSDSVTRLALRPLTAAALHDLLRDRLGAAPPRPVLTRISDVSLGNPYAALELARSWMRSTDPTEAASVLDPLAVPATLRDLIAQDLLRLTPDARQVLTVIAAVEHPASALVEATLRAGETRDASTSDETVDALLTGLRADGLLKPGEPLALSHPLIGEVLLEDLGPVRRRELHRRLASLVAEPDAQARHLALGTSEPDEAVATRLEAASGRIARRGATLQAADVAAAAARLTPTDALEGRARRQVLEARLRLALGDVSRARDLADAAERGVGEGVSAELKVEVAELRANLAWADGQLGAARDRLRDAISRTDDPAIGARIGARLVGLQVALEPATVGEVAADVLRVLDESSHPGVAGYVRINQFFGQVVAGGAADLALLEEGLQLERAGLDDGPISSIPLIWLNAIDATAAARTRHELEDAWYGDRGEDGWRAERRSHRALTELRAGDWERAERDIEASCSMIEAFEAPGSWPAPFGWRALVDAHRGRIERARSTLAPLIETADRQQNHQWAGLLWSVAAFVEYAARNASGADAAVSAMQQRFAEIGFHEVLGDRSEPFHVEVLLELGARERAGAALERLERRGATVPRPWIDLGLARARALMLADDGAADAGIEVLDRVEPSLAARLPFDGAWNDVIRGQLLRRSGRRLEAAAALRSAIDVLDRLGAVPWARRARSELDRVGLRRGDPLALTPTESRIAELAASGLTNRAVAAAAFVSPKTVEANLARVYTKLGIRSRAELGARMGMAARDEDPSET